MIFLFKLPFKFLTIEKMALANDLFYYCSKPYKNKCFEVQLSQWSSFSLEFNLDIKFSGEDHAGPKLMMQFAYWFFSIQLYDTRHWNDDENTWHTTESMNKAYEKFEANLDKEAIKRVKRKKLIA